jgi:hypothetical protein
MSLREVLNFWAFIMLLLAMLVSVFLLDDLVQHNTVDYAESMFVVVSLAPAILLVVTGQAFGAAFIGGLFWSNSRAAHSHYRKELSLARAGKGREAAAGMLLRDRVFGDTRALMTILEMARQDKDMMPEAMRATHRLLGNWKLSKADRDHVGRLVSQIKISSSSRGHEKTLDLDY